MNERICANINEIYEEMKQIQEEMDRAHKNTRLNLTISFGYKMLHLWVASDNVNAIPHCYYFEFDDVAGLKEKLAEIKEKI